MNITQIRIVQLQTNQTEKTQSRDDVNNSTLYD